MFRSSSRDVRACRRVRAEGHASRLRFEAAALCFALRVGLVFVAATPATALAQSSFQWLPDNPMFTFNFPTRLSDDGSTVIGAGSIDRVGPFQGYRWRADTGMVLRNGHTDLSVEGSVVVGGILGTAYRWTEATGSVSLGDFSGGPIQSAAQCVTGDGSVVFGFGTDASGSVPFRWTQATGLEPLALPGAPSLATPDGSVLVGFGPTTYYRWTQAGGAQSMGTAPGGISHNFYDLTEDGILIVGGGVTPGDPALKWTPANGIEVLDSNYSTAWAVAPDGSLIGGSYGDPNFGAIWHPDGTFEEAIDFLRAHVECMPDEEIWTVKDIAINGNVVTMVGDGYGPRGGQATWIATYPLNPTPPGPEIVCRAGNMNTGVGDPVNVLFINNSPGSCPERVIQVTPSTPISVRVQRPPSNGSRYAMYLWPRLPGVADMRTLPQSIGTACMPMPPNPGTPQPLRRANNIGVAQFLGTENWPGPSTLPAPYTLLNLPAGLGRTGNFFFQGIMIDAFAPNGRAGVTNGILVVSQ
ncbi:MAG: hypothetical protein HY292_09865 [Planctomycetes bacterium]|nr:hypothetical protein [Planctomycetota bacterium]